MARPYITTSDKNGSLMSPMSAGSNTPISYRANVNRQKTKKWAEAKKIDYGGDDWGDDDDYDPYDAYGNELQPAPAPVSRPTGLRQQSQGLPSTRGMSQERIQKSYGNLPSTSTASRLNRRNSFEADDETRHFSNSTIRQESISVPSPPQAAEPPTATATRFSQSGVSGMRDTRNSSGPPALQISTQQASPTGLRKPWISANPAPHAASYSNEPMSLPTRTSTNDSSILSAGSINTPSYYETSKDFSPSAVPAPLTMRASPDPQSATNETPAARFPARKSSLSTMGPDAQRIHQTSQETLAKPTLTTSGRPASPGSAARSIISPGASNTKFLPFIRPADIYRRVKEEEQERDRSSMDSARPSMDSIQMERSSDRSHSPSQGGILERSSSDSLGHGHRGRYSSSEESEESGRRLTPILEPVKERRSEYAYEGFNANETPSPDQEILTHPAALETTSPKLPDLNRIPVFGAEFFSHSKPDSGSGPPAETIAERSEIASPEDFRQTDDTSLRSQPSFGFKSVVNQAFDRTSDNSIPPTPASKTGSDLRRSDSESTGTTGISPIMSRGPSTSVIDNRTREMSTPAIMELAEPKSPISRDVEHEDAEEMPPPGFIPGHRRNISTPSPGNSPARTPDLSNAPKRISMGEHAWISSASLTSPMEDESQKPDIQSARPTFDRDVSFRPQLPGGWQSYATTATANTVQSESVCPSSPQMPVDSAQDIGAGDLTPTTTKHSLPESSLEAACITLGVKSDSMPSPDVSGNVHSAMAPHPELLSTMEKASPEAKSNSLAAEESSPAESLPVDVLVSGDPAISEPTTALQGSLGNEIDTDDALLPPSRPQVLPTLSTETGSSDEESDKLRKEIVKSLSQRHDSNNMDESRDSTYLTDVYDDYWNDTGDEKRSSPIATTSSPLKLQPEQVIPADMPEIRPLSSHRMSNQQTRPPLPTRFSWEKSLGGINQPDIDLPEPSRSHAEVPVNNVDAPLDALQHFDSEPYMEKEVLQEPSQVDYHPERNLALGTGAALLGGGATAATSQISNIESPPTFNVLLAPEKGEPQSAPHPVTSTPETEQLAYESSLDLTIDPLGSNPHSPAIIPRPLTARESSPSRRESATSHRNSNLGKILTFKEIVAMKDAHERVHAFDETRERFAAMDSGIHEWVLALKAEQAEHDDVTESYGGFRSSVQTGSTRRNTKSGGGSIQSPYYQQYLNASAPSQSSTPASRLGQTGSLGIQQSFSPAHAKITTQQVQAKGKEFFHTAGMFGGKAGKAGFQAGKGLLAKGKNRLRAAGSSDKTSPPPKPRNPNRSSWGLALHLSKATNQTDPSRHTEQNMASGPINRPRLPTSSDKLTPAGLDGLPLDDVEAQAARAELAEESDVLSRENAGEILAPDVTEDQHLANNPDPFSKYQTTRKFPHTIHEIGEGRLINDEQINQYITGTGLTTEELSNPTGPSTGMRSNSGDAAIYDASEEQLGPKDPVLTSSITREEIMQPSSNVQPLPRYPISMMNRPRGASLDQAAIPDQPIRSTIKLDHNPHLIQSANNNTISLEGQGRQPSIKALPPIRRTSKFGFEFGSRKPQTRFPISDDEDEDGCNNDLPRVAASNTVTNDTEEHASEQVHREHVSLAEIVRKSRPNIQTGSQPRFSVFPHVPGPVSGSVSHDSHTQDVRQSRPAVMHTRQDSWNTPDKSRSRRGSASDLPFPQRRDSNAAPPLIPILPFESPPSSTQRYPELFGPVGIEIKDNRSMPGGYHQASKGQTEVFPPFQPTSEPRAVPFSQTSQEPPTGHRRRRSSDLVNRGIKLVRSISRERKGSLSRDGRISTEDTFAAPPARDDRDRKRGSGFWGNYDFTGEEPPSDPPIGRESMVANYSGSQSNFMASPQDSPRTPRSFFNSNITSDTPRSNILGRSTTTIGKGFPKEEKRSRLAGLSGIFLRSPKGDGSALFKPRRATTELSSFGPRSGTLTSPQHVAQNQQDANVEHKRRPSQPLNFLTKFAPSSSFQKTEAPRQDSKPHQDPHPPWRPSVSGLLTGMLRKRSNTLDKDSERSDDDGRRPVIVPVARIYSDLPSESHEILPDPVPTHTQKLKKSDQGRGRARSPSNFDFSKQEYLDSRSHQRSHRPTIPTPPIPEPRYDAVPIPGRYDLVRGEGPTAKPKSYDPHGMSNVRRASLGDTLSTEFQQHSVPSPVWPLAHSILHPSLSFHETSPLERRLPRLPSIDTHNSSITSPIHTHRPSHEDMLARSPAREQPGQQRPFQLMLPHGSTANSHSSRSSTPPIPPTKDHLIAPRSPSSILLPAEEYSQLGEKIDIDRFPLPPSPPQHSTEWYRERNLSVATDEGLQRSSTGRSLVSAVSQISDVSSHLPQTENISRHTFHEDDDIDSGNDTPRETENLYDANTSLSRRDENMIGKYTERNEKPEMIKYRGMKGEEDTYKTKEEVNNGDIENEAEHEKEERLQMSSTSYPGMEWNPYAGGYGGDD